MTRRTPLAALVSARHPSRAALAGVAGVAGLLVLAVPRGADADDRGDAPERYGIASHGVATPAMLWLGDRAPDEEAPVFSLGADGDDNLGDDEDGVFAFPDLVQNGKAYTTNVFATNRSSAPATLSGWVDIDGNGLFDADEFATARVPAGAENAKFKLVWPDLSGVSTDFTGETYARFRLSSQALGGGEASGRASDGEVEDYLVTIQPDADGDERPDATDPDDDNDGIPDEVEVIGRDTDGDGVPDYLDSDSDGDGVPDFTEAGPVPDRPVDSDGDGIPDYLDRDSDNDGVFDGEQRDLDRDADTVPDALEGDGDADDDGIPNREDLDSDNDSIPDAIEAGVRDGALRDTDGDRVPDIFDLDSDDDGIPDLYEANSGEVNVRPLDDDTDGRLDTVHAFSANGFADALETSLDSGIPLYAVPDTDGDGVRDFRDRDSDGDGVSDLREAGRPDRDGDGQVDERIDSDNDGLIDGVDVDNTGGSDRDGDGVADAFDPTETRGPDFDGDGIVDAADNDADGDGITDGGNARFGRELPDTNQNGIPDFQDVEVPTGGPGSGTGGGVDEGGDDGAADGSADGGTDGGDDGAADGSTDGTADGQGGDDGATGAGTATGGVGDDGGTDGATDGASDGNATVGGSDGGAEVPRDDPARIETGLSGGAGCSIATAGPNGGMDPLFALGLAGALFGLIRRRRQGGDGAVLAPFDTAGAVDQGARARTN